MNGIVQILLMNYIEGYINMIEESDFSDSFDSDDSYDIIDLPRIRINVIYVGIVIYYKHIFVHL